MDHCRVRGATGGAGRAEWGGEVSGIKSVAIKIKCDSKGTWTAVVLVDGEFYAQAWGPGYEHALREGHHYALGLTGEGNDD